MSTLNTHLLKWLAVCLSALFVAGCGAAATPTPGVTILIDFAATATPTPTETPTATPVPPTATPLPTETPLPTATPEPSPTPTETATPTPTPTATGTPTQTPTPWPTATRWPTVVPVTITTEIPPAAMPVVLPPNTLNIALLGVDTRPIGGGLNTDIIVIASINPDAPAVTLLSIPRDTLVYIPGWRWHKVNTAFARGGPDMFKQTILHNFGIKVDYYAMVNFSGVVRAVNTVGGIDVVATCPLYQVFPQDPFYMANETTPMTVTQPYQDMFTGEVWEPGTAVPTMTIYIGQPGVYTLNGLQALAFARARDVPGGDMDRGRRAQTVIRALINKARQAGMIPKIPELFAQFQREVKTDLPLDKLITLGGLAANFDDGLIRSRYLDAGGLVANMLPEIGYVLVPISETMGTYLQQALPVALNQRPNDAIPIEVWNGGGYEDFGVASAARLAELGFRVVNITTTQQVYPKTQIVNFETTGKGSAVPMLQRTFSITNENVIAQPGAGGTGPNAPRYRIIVGRDFNPCYRTGYQFAKSAIPVPQVAPQDAPQDAPQPTADPNATPPAAPTETPTPPPQP